MAREGLDDVRLAGGLAHYLQGSVTYLICDLVLRELAREALGLHYEVHDLLAFILVCEVQIESLHAAIRETDQKH